MKLSCIKGPSPKCTYLGTTWQVLIASRLKVDITWQTPGAIGTLSFKLMCLQRGAYFYKTPLILLHVPCLCYVKIFGDLWLSCGLVIYWIMNVTHYFFTLNHFLISLFLMHKVYVILSCQWLLWNAVVQNIWPILC